MAAGNFIKDNLALVAGIAVPVVLVAGFLLAGVLGKALAAPPAHTAYFVTTQHDSTATTATNLSLGIDDNARLRATVTPAHKNSGSDIYNSATDILVAYDAASGSLREYRFPRPASMTKGSFTPDEFKDTRLSPQQQAPDGYAVTHGRGRNSGLIGDIFLSRAADGYRIRKGSAVYHLPEYTNASRPYYNLRFLGWSTEPQP